jgi:hypothetical protein
MKRKILFLSNIGNSDLGKDEKPIFNPREHNIFEESKKLYESGDFYNLEPILLKKKIEKLNNPINDLEIVLFATMQEEENPQDTYYIAKIVKELLIKDFPNLKDKIKIERISRNPADYGEMIEYYAEKLDKFNDDYDRVYLGITGGTPAQISSLIINGVLKWEEKVRTIYKPRGKEPKENKIGEKIFKILKSKEFEAFKKSHMYDLASELVMRFKLVDNWECEYHYLKGLHYKKLFDFKRAKEEFNIALEFADLEYQEKISKELGILEELSKEPKSLDERIKKYALLIDLLIDNAIMKWENGEYVDFVGRIFRIEEALLRVIFEREFKIGTDKESFEDFKKFLIEHEDIVEFIKKELDLKELEPKPTRKVLFGILMYMVKKMDKGKELRNIYEPIKRIEKLGDLRNTSIIAHGFDGISKEDIIMHYNKNNEDEDKIIKDLENIKQEIKKLL